MTGTKCVALWWNGYWDVTHKSWTRSPVTATLILKNIMYELFSIPHTYRKVHLRNCITINFTEVKFKSPTHHQVADNNSSNTNHLAIKLHSPFPTFHLFTMHSHKIFVVTIELEPTVWFGCGNLTLRLHQLNHSIETIIFLMRIYLSKESNTCGVLKFIWICLKMC